MPKNCDVWVFSEKSDLLAELIAAGTTLAKASQGAVVAIVLGPRPLVDEMAGDEAGRTADSEDAEGGDKLSALLSPAPRGQ